MSPLFISHSSKNDDWAIAIKDWLVREGWSGPEDIFLDLDPERGIAAGQRWALALEDAATRCEAVLFLVSEGWLSSKWCGDEYQLANRLNKKLFALLIDDVALDRLPGGLAAQWQVVRLRGEPAERFVTVHPVTQQQSPVHIANSGLASLKRGLVKAGIGTETFELHSDQNGPFGWRAPYRGLEALEPEDAAVFFGRNADMVRGIDMLRGIAARKPPRLMVILGASGAGKSSFLRAGLWPRLLRDDSQWLPVRAIRAGRGGAIEGNEGLLAALEDVRDRFGLPLTRSVLRDRLATPEAFVALLTELRQVAARRALISEPPYPLPVLCLDQAEEVFAADATAEIEKFLALARAAVDADAALLLVSIRSDSYGTMQAAQQLAGIDQVALTLGPVPHGEIARVIREPAEILRRKVGSAAPVFDAAVIERLQQEIEGEDDALPLLAFVMQRLMREHQGVAVIGMHELDRTGGVAAAIESAAEAALDDAGIGRDRPSRRDALRRLFVPRLARIDRDSRAPQRRVALQSELPGDLAGLARALTQRRLLVTKAMAGIEGTPSAGSTLEVAHEALLRRWPTLTNLLAEDRDALLLLDGVVSAAVDWQKANAQRKPDYLSHRGSRLADAQALESRGPDWARELAPARAYLAACAAQEMTEREAQELALKREQAQVARTRKLQKRTAWALAAIFVVVVGALASVLWQSFQTSKREASIFASVGAPASSRGACDLAMRLALAGLPPTVGVSPIAYRSSELQDQLSVFGSARNCYFQMAFVGHSSAVGGAKFGPDGTYVVTSSNDGTTRVWNTSTGKLITTLSGFAAAISQDGTQIATSLGYTAQVWDASTGATRATLSGHTAEIVSIAFSPDGDRVVTGSLDHTARVWTASTGDALVTLSGHDRQVNSVAFSPDGTRIVTASADNTGRLWNATTGAPLATMTGHTEWVNSASFSPDGGRIATASTDGTARIWDGKTGAAVATLTGHTERVGRAVYSSDGSRVLTVAGDNTARVWDAACMGTCAALAILRHEASVNSAAFSRDGMRVVTASDDKTARLWNVVTCAGSCTALATLAGHEAQVFGAAFSPDGMHVITASGDKTARLWDATGGALVATLAPAKSVRSAALSPDGARIVTTSEDDSIARLWDSNTGAVISVLTGHTDAVASAIFSPDGTRVLTASGDKTARIWDAKTGAAVATLSGNAKRLIGAVYNPEGTRIVTISSDQTARLWDAKSGEPLMTLSDFPATSTLPKTAFSVAFSADGTRIVVASQLQSARLWDAATGATIATLPGDSYKVSGAAFSPDGARIVTPFEDTSAKVWDTKTGALVATLTPDSGMTIGAIFSPDGGSIAATDFDTVHLWDVRACPARCNAAATLRGHTGIVNSVAFSSDGKRIVTASEDRTARLWDATTGAMLGVLTGHTGPVNSAAFSPDGKRVITVSDDHTARIWQLDPLILMAAGQRQDYICRDRLIGAQSFTDLEMQDPILRGREDLRTPCTRVGPLALTYYWRTARTLGAKFKGLLAQH